MDKLNFEQIANFSYWLTETHDNRGANKFDGKERINYIQNILLPKFLNKYPNGILTGWQIIR